MNSSQKDFLNSAAQIIFKLKTHELSLFSLRNTKYKLLLIKIEITFPQLGTPTTLAMA